MSIQPFEPADLILRGPTQVAASVPYLLGFQPSDSVVVVFATVRGRHILTARVDVPHDPEGTVAMYESALAICERAHEQRAAYVSFVIYPPDDGAGVRLPVVVEALRQAVERTHLSLDSIATVQHGTWRDELDRDAPALLLDEVGLDAAAQWVAHGVTYEASREDLAARICGPETDTSRAVREVIERNGDKWRRELVKTAASRRQMEDQIVAYVTVVNINSCSEARDHVSPVPSAEEIAAWVIALADNRVREPLLWRLADGFLEGEASAIRLHQDALARLCALVRNTPAELAAPIASCAAAYAWQLGDGASAGIAADHGLNANPRNVLCGLVMSAVAAGVHPRVWLDMLRSMTLKQLRSGPRRSKSELLGDSW